MRTKRQHHVAEIVGSGAAENVASSSHPPMLLTCRDSFEAANPAPKQRPPAPKQRKLQVGVWRMLRMFRHRLRSHEGDDPTVPCDARVSKCLESLEIVRQETGGLQGTCTMVHGAACRKVHQMDRKVLASRGFHRLWHAGRALLALILLCCFTRIFPVELYPGGPPRNPRPEPSVRAGLQLSTAVLVV